jgi:hypothetical protein
VGRKPLITAGMILQGIALALMAATTGFGPWALGAVLIGAGTALVYPTLLAAVWVVAALSIASGLVVATRMTETHAASDRAKLPA